MKTLEQGSQRIQKISEELRTEIIDPAKLEAAKIIAEAQAEAHAIVEKGREDAKKLYQEAHGKILQETNVFQASLSQASKQSLEALRQEIERSLFSQEIQTLIQKQTSDPKVIAKILETILKAIEKDGISANLSAVIPQAVSASEVNALLGDNLLKRLSEKSVVLGKFAGGGASAHPR